MQHTILVVDDQPAVLSILRGMLSKGPYTVLSARSAKEAMDILERNSVDVIISDERMPGMSGSDFFAIVRHHFPETVRIILTGYASLDSAIKAINEGEIYRFLTKPCRRQELHAAIEDALAYKAKGTEEDRQASVMASLEKQAPGAARVKKDDDTGE